MVTNQDILDEAIGLKNEADATIVTWVDTLETELSDIEKERCALQAQIRHELEALKIQRITEKLHATHG
jgi:hypothetical protein